MLEELVEIESVGKFLKHNLKAPYSSSVNYIMLFLGRDYQLWDGNKCFAFTYVDDQGNQGIVVLDGDYDAKAYELAKMYEEKHPESERIAVHFVNK